MKPTHIRVSLVIPVYNEEHHITACLRAIAAQTVAPFEVIVVDNNCTDNSMALAQRFPFVRVVTEPERGLVFSRDAGFNAARGDVIGRIDADTLLDADWIETVQRLFLDSEVDALSGSVDYYDIPLKWLVGGIDLQFRKLFAWRLKREMYLFGANMAIRRSAWRKVRGHVCHERALHEDFDLAVHLARLPDAATIKFVPQLHARVSARCVDANLQGFYSYMVASPRTYAAHGLRSQRIMYSLIWFLVCMYGPIWFLYRASDPVTGQFGWRYFFQPSGSRPVRRSPVSAEI